MTSEQWRSFAEFRDTFRELCREWLGYAAALEPLQRAACAADTPPYPLETAVVYNRAYDEVSPEDDIRLIVVGDNPGKEEQRVANRRYLVGQSGRIAEGFFRRNPELGVDFRRNALIMNKTPVHTAKTSHLRYVARHGSGDVAELVLNSQTALARLAARLHQGLVRWRGAGEPAPQLWLVGYAELRGKGIFVPYRDALREAYRGCAEAWDAVRVFQHFSMNRFLIDLKAFRERSGGPLGLRGDMDALGRAHRDEILGPNP